MAAPRCRDCGGTDWAEDGRCRACRSFPTLGFLVADFIESKCVVPDREQAGQPFELIDPQLRFLLYHYRLRPTAVFDERRGVWRRVWTYDRGSQLTRPQKWGKGPFAAAMVCAEAEGPVCFDGWDADGQPVGRPWATPVIQITALSESQAGNVWDALLPMIELGAIAGDIPDTGITRINLQRGGEITPVTSSPGSRLGQRIKFLVQDQTESWTASNGGRKLADNQRRNLAGMGGRWLSTPNAWDPTENSVAQYTAEFERAGVWHDDVEPPESLSIRNKKDRRKALRIVYEGAWWADLDRIDSEIEALLPRDPAQAERWFLNRKHAREAKAFSGARWDELATGEIAADGSLIVIGVDGARFVDALAIIATDVLSGVQWPLGIWERPESAPDDYEHPFDEIDGVMIEAFELYDPWRALIDPQYIEHLVSRWQGRWGQKRVLPWFTNRPRQMAWAVRRYSEAIAAGDVTHIGDEQFTRHIKNAVRSRVGVYDDQHRQLHVITKDRPDSPRKIDAAAAGVISWEARSDAIAAGATIRPSRGAVFA